MSDLILRRSHGFQLDHIGLGVRNTEDGVKWVAEQTGADVQLHDPEPGQWYWSGSLNIGEDSYSEVIGPNPDWKKFHPFGTLLKTLTEPKLLFWYIAVTDFKAFQKLAAKHKGKLERVEAINVDNPDTGYASYHRGYIGPGFLSERPNVIGWLRKPDRVQDIVPTCKLVDFKLANPKADQINPVFKALGIETEVTNGRSSIAITLETPNGLWTIENEGLE